MDPEKCLIEAAELVKTGRSECAQKLADYFDWRVHGGFEPYFCGTTGDRFYMQVLIQLGLVADTLSEALTERSKEVVV